MLSALNASPRSCVLILSVMRVFFSSEISRLVMAGPRTSGRRRPTLPYVNEAGTVNAVVSNHSLIFCARERSPGRPADLPVLFGRLPPPVMRPRAPEDSRFGKLTPNRACQPPTSVENQAVRMRKKRFARTKWKFVDSVHRQ